LAIPFGIASLHASSVYVGGAIATIGDRAFAQSNIVPDDSLGAESSVVTPNFDDLPVEVIDGGAQRGANLFHSFREFNIDEGRGAYFRNPTGIENILSRVTGGNRSDILGTLGVLGNANLFLINPNGIIFTVTVGYSGTIWWMLLGISGLRVGRWLISAVEGEVT
jgi:filamentous hemagglutinin family protein